MMMDGNVSGGSGSGDPHHNQGGGGVFSNTHGRQNKQSHHHTAQQIERLESMFKDCPHPDETDRLQLSRVLNLTPAQIKFWFQNRRTQMKVQHERADNCSIQEENDRIRCENIAIKDAMKNVLCHSCGGPPLGEDELKLLMEYAQLKEQLERVSSIAAKYLGSELPAVQPDCSVVQPDCNAVQPGYSTVQPDYFAVQPDCRAVQPDYFAVQPDCSAVQPDYFVVQPDCSAVQPDYFSVQPDCSAVQPDYFAVQPDCSAVQPDYFAMQPDCSVVQPDYFAVQPGCSTVQPDYFVVQPDCRAVQPDYFAVQPDCSAMQPDYFVVQPDCSVVQPDYFAVQPDCSAVQPDYFAVQPDCSDVLPDYFAVQPDCSAMQPDYFVVQPDCSVVQPDYFAVQPDCSAVQPDYFAVQPDCSDVLPDYFAVQPDCIALQPDCSVVEPDYFAVQPDCSAMQPDCFAVQPDLSMSTNYHALGMQGSSATSVINPISGGGTMNIPDMADVRFKVAGNAMDELLMLFQYNEPLWVKSPDDGRDFLNVEMYDGMFPGPNRLKSPNTRIESSRDSAIVYMNSLALVDMFMDVNKWVEVFPNIVSSARTLEVISSGMMGSQSGRLQLMYEELQVLSPFVPPRPLYFLRFCQQIEQTTWAIVDVSVEIPPENQFGASSPACKTYRFPSGCLIQELPPSGFSNVIWVEHLQIDETVGVHRLYRDLFQTGRAFSADRWVTTLHRVCDRYYSRDIVGGVLPCPKENPPSLEGKRNMMKLAHRLVTSFCASINPSNGHQWTTLLGLMGGYDVRAMLYESTLPGQPNGVVLIATTTIWLPIPPQHVFDYLRDPSTRPQWDHVLSKKNPVGDVLHIANGSNLGNCISVLGASDTCNNDMLILQESCVDTSGSMVVFSPIDPTSISLTMSGEDPSYIYTLPSGFAILPDGCNQKTGSGQGASSSSGGISSGSLLTVVLQISVDSLLSAKMSPQMENMARNLIRSTMDQIKAAFNCTTTSS